MLMLACDAGALVLLARAAAALFLSRQTAVALEPAALIGLFATSAAASCGFLLLHRERADAGLRRLAAYDPLTEAFNRLAFMHLAESQAARARRSGEPCALLMLDVDHFARVNGRFRREAGDRVLRELAAVLRGAVRAGDLIGRYGGEEFCVLLANTTLPAALEVAERLRATVAVRRLAGVAPSVTVSIGVAPCEPERSGAIHVAIAGAERALARAKKDGCNRVAGPRIARRVPRAA
jgi:diguanylate cyclase (GGDEF)-like protein